MDTQLIQKSVVALEKEISELEKRLNTYRSLLKQYQEICQHTYDDGESAIIEVVTFNRRYSFCKICHKKESY